jgi:hypothetical protein
MDTCVLVAALAKTGAKADLRELLLFELLCVNEETLCTGWKPAIFHPVQFLSSRVLCIVVNCVLSAKLNPIWPGII